MYPTPSSYKLRQIKLFKPVQIHLHSQPSIVPGNKPLILVIEDNIEMNQFISETFNPNYQVTNVYNGQEGVDLAKKFNPDLVICDVMMPIMSGDPVVADELLVRVGNLAASYLRTLDERRSLNADLLLA